MGHMIRVLSLLIILSLFNSGCDLINILNNDSETIILLSASYSDDEPYQLYIYDVESGAFDKLTNEKYGVRYFDWSKETKRIVYGANLDKNQTIAFKTVKLDGTFSNTLKTKDGENVFGSYAHWSPDGKSITYQFGPAVHGYFSEEEIYTYHVDNKRITQLTDNWHWDFFPVWSSDGEKVYFNSERDGEFNLFSMNITNNKEEQISFERKGFGFRWFDKEQNLLIYDSRDSLINGTTRWVNRIFDLNTNDSYQLTFAPYKSKTNFNYRLIEYVDQTTVLLAESHSWNYDHGTTLYFWNTETGELKKIFDAPSIGKAQVIDIH